MIFNFQKLHFFLNFSAFRYRHGFIGVGRMEAKVVSVCLDFQAVSLISKSQSSPLKADEFEID